MIGTNAYRKYFIGECPDLRISFPPGVNSLLPLAALSSAVFVLCVPVFGPGLNRVRSQAAGRLLGPNKARKIAPRSR